MFETRDNRAWAIIVVFAVVIGYFSLSWAGVIPDDYNVVTHYFSNEAEDNTTINQNIDYNEVYVNGIPSYVDLSSYSNYTYISNPCIEFTAENGVCEGMTITLNVQNSMTNATICLSQGDDPYEQWQFSPDGHQAIYTGVGIIPYESVSLTLTISGDEFTRGGSVMVVCSSNGETHQNEGIIHITV